MMAAPAYTIAVTITQRPVSSGNQVTTISTDGSGDADHFLSAFRAAMVASGYSCDYASGLHLLSIDESAGCTD